MHRSEEAVIVKMEDGSYRGVAWNRTMEGSGEDLKLSFEIPMDAKEVCVLTETVDEKTCNPLKLWHDMGEPSSLTERQKKVLKEGAKPLAETARRQVQDGMASVELYVRENGVVYFELQQIKAGGDRGYDYARTIGKRA